MNIQQSIVNQLEKLAVEGPQSVDAVVQESPHSALIMGVFSDKGVGISLNLEGYDQYSVALRYLELYNKGRTVAQDGVETFLRGTAKAIAEQLTYLEEPLEVLEVDLVDQEAQIRSNPPDTTSRENESIYWEIVLQATPYPTAKLTRYRWSAGQADREIVAYPITFVNVGRIAKDLKACLTNVSSEDN